MKISNIKATKISFGSYEHREYALERLREQQERERQRQLELERKRIEERRLKEDISKLKQEISIMSKYRGLTEPLCDEMAAVMLNFSCSMMMESEHDLREFFGTEEQAKIIRQNLTPECQKLSIEMREAINKTQMSSDPIFGLITVNRLKDYMPEDGILTDEQYNSISENTKFACTELIKNSNLSDFDDTDKSTIAQLIETVENTDGLNFGKEYDDKLQKLIDKANQKYKTKLNNSEYTKTFIPPVAVRYNEEELAVKKEREREVNR